MSWQDELHKLDSALASGQLSADEYRTRRDQVIAQASGQQQPQSQQPAPQQGAEPTHVFRPVQPPSQGEDRTQAVPGQGAGSDRTQVVSGQDNSSDNTQVVPGPAAAGQPHFPPPPPPPPWETQHPQQHISQPPWANDDLPPEFGQQSWPRQGPEIFEEPGKSKTGKVVGIIVAVVLVLGLAGAAVWWFGLRESTNDPPVSQSSENNPPETTSSAPPEPQLPEGPFVPIDGDEVLNTTVTMEKALSQKRPTEKEATLLSSVGVTQVSALIADKDDVRRGIWAFEIGEGKDPKAVLAGMDAMYDRATYELVSESDGVLVRKLTPTSPEKPTVFRAHYLTDDGYLVRVESYGQDVPNVKAAFDDLLAEQTGEFPAVR